MRRFSARRVSPLAILVYGLVFVGLHLMACTPRVVWLLSPLTQPLAHPFQWPLQGYQVVRSDESLTKIAQFNYF